ncbi:MAG: hypothetical protein J2P39_14790, partial [Candidatus Dormibacteraeota bacterium]|nr:hypothetical protein [Candidatus Dormibacteraeota bacterium]
MGQGSGEVPRPVDVAIVGAGPDGLVAASLLHGTYLHAPMPPGVPRRPAPDLPLVRWNVHVPGETVTGPPGHEAAMRIPDGPGV